MTEANAIATQIKKYIKYRNKNIRQTADEMGIGYTTFCEQLNRGTLKADTLFRLAAYLEIDLNWMMKVLNYVGQINEFEKENVPRMSPSYRKNELKNVLERMDYHIRQFPESTSEIRRGLLQDFSNNMFYLLDVLVPEEYDISVYKERDKTKYCVVYFNPDSQSHTSMGSRRSMFRTITANATDALNNAIENRKEEIL